MILIWKHNPKDKHGKHMHKLVMCGDRRHSPGGDVPGTRWMCELSYADTLRFRKLRRKVRQRLGMPQDAVMDYVS